MNMMMPQPPLDLKQKGRRSLPSQPLLEYPPKFDMDMVQRLLGRRKKDRLTRATRRRVDTYYRPVLNRLAPLVTWKVYGLADLEAGAVRLENGVCLNSRKMTRTLAGAEKVVCFVATVGAGIDRMIDSFVKKGRVADAYVIDALGSGAVEHTAQTFQDDFVATFSRRPYVAGLRFSPGYCDWPIKEQNTIFSLLDCSNIGVNLSDTALMDPRKTVSAVFGLYRTSRAPTLLSANPCRRCGHEDCIARRTTVEPSSRR